MLTRDILICTALSAVSGAVGSVVMYLMLKKEAAELSSGLDQAKIDSLPKRIILVRHGESCGNADHNLYREKADNQINLTDRGRAQAIEAGKKIKELIGDNARVQLFVSPFNRTLQTADLLRCAFNDHVAHTSIETNIREQEFGNLQDDQHTTYRLEQRKVGRFWYRFPTGESGADVYSRVKLWFNELIRINRRPGMEKVDTIVAVTHGLTMRLVLMQMFGWSPNTFHTVWNAGNCDFYVLDKKEGWHGELQGEQPSPWPYHLNTNVGATIKSSVELVVTMKDGEVKKVGIENYLDLPPPRICRRNLILKELEKEHQIDPSLVARVQGDVNRGFSEEEYHDGNYTHPRCSSN